MKQAVFAAVLVLSGCQTATQEQFAQWADGFVGRSETAVVDDIGIPDKTYSLEGARYIEFSRSLIVGDRHGIGTYGCTLTFRVEGGIIQRWNSTGNHCVGAP